jgi:MraZ protein
MMYIGQHIQKIDKQQRVAVPKAFIQEGQRSFIVNRNSGCSLILHNKELWEKTSEIIGQLDLEEKKNRDFARIFFRGATDLEIDTKGRIKLPSVLLEYIRADKEILFNGILNRIELWSPEIFKTQLLNANQSIDFLYPINQLTSADPEDFRQLTSYLRTAYKNSIL